MRTLCPNFLLFYGNLTVFSILFWNFMIILSLSVLLPIDQCSQILFPISFDMRFQKNLQYRWR